MDPLRDPARRLSKRSIFYAYDKSDVEAQYRPLIETHAGYLRGHPGATVVIYGNTDERGSRECNLALGHKRAEAVLRQMEAVSFGEEKPGAAGHDEGAWSQNRRSDAVYGRER